MSNLIQPSQQAASLEVIGRLTRAGYLRPELRHDADAISAAIARLKEDLRGSGKDKEGAEAA